RSRHSRACKWQVGRVTWQCSSGWCPGAHGSGKSTNMPLLVLGVIRAETKPTISASSACTIGQTVLPARGLPAHIFSDSGKLIRYDGWDPDVSCRHGCPTRIVTTSIGISSSLCREVIGTHADT